MCAIAPHFIVIHIIYMNILYMLSTRSAEYGFLEQDLQCAKANFPVCWNAVADILTFLEVGENLMKAKAQRPLLMNLCYIF